MSSWELWTLIAIAILVVGSLAVFLWFLVEVVSIARERRSARKEGSARKEDESR